MAEDSCVDSFRVTSVTRYICSRRTIIRATSDWRGVQPTRFAFGTAAAAGSTVVLLAVTVPMPSPVTDAEAVLIQLPFGITRESSRM